MRAYGEHIIITRVFSELEQFLTRWLGNPSDVGAASWLQAFTWVATLVVAMIAGISLRRNALQNRATLLLSLYKTWEDLAPQRHDFSEFFVKTRREVLKQHAGLQPKPQLEHMKQSFQKKLASLRDKRDPKFSQFISYISFFEILGMYVKNGYVPLRDIMQVYKGPIFDIDTAWRDFIKEWQKDAHIPAGLLEHAVFLTDMTSTRTTRPIYYWTIYHFRRKYF